MAPLFLFGSGDLLLIFVLGENPISQNQYCQASKNDACVVHVGNFDWHTVGKAEKHNCKDQPTHCDAVDNPTQHAFHMEPTLVHVFPSGQHIGQDGDQIRAVVDRNCRAEHTVESSAAAEVNTAESSIDGCDTELCIQRHAKLAAHASPKLGEWQCTVA